MTGRVTKVAHVKVKAPIKTEKGVVLKEEVNEDDEVGDGIKEEVKDEVKQEIGPNHAEYSRGLQHLISVDSRFLSLLQEFPPTTFNEPCIPPDQHFSRIVHGIMAQQISGHAARAVESRFVALFPLNTNGFPTPEQVATKDVAKLKEAGLSGRKAEYVLDVAENFISGSLASLHHDHDDEDIVKRLTSVRGIGVWSAHMFLMFALKRLDIMPVGDLGVQRGMAVFDGRDVAKLRNKPGSWKYMSLQDMEARSAAYKPYRSLFAWMMWRLDGTTLL